MKVLYISSNFPEKSKGDSIYTDLACSIYNAGHLIDVFVCGSKKKTIVENERGYRTIRTASMNYFVKNMLLKGIAFFRMPHSIKRAIKKYGAQNYDLILFEAPPVSFSNVCRWASKRFNAPIFLMQKDFFPENARDLGLMREKSIVYKIFRRYEKQCFKDSDYIGVMSQKNKTFLLEKNSIPALKSFVFPNTINVNNYVNISLIDKKIIEQIKGKFVVGVIGNLGKAQSVPLLIDVVTKLSMHKDIAFIFAGRGTELEYIKKAVSNNYLHNLILMPNPTRELSDALTYFCDIGLVSIDFRFKIPNFPSRSLSYMKLSKPIVAATDLNTDFGYYVTKVYKSGLWSSSQDSNEIINNILLLKNNNDYRKELGENGRRFLLDYLSVKSSVTKLENLIFDDGEVQIKKIKSKEIVKQIVSIHKSAFSNFFLTSLGGHFLLKFYLNYLNNDSSGIYGAYLNGKLVGFLSYTFDNSRIGFRTIVKNPFSIAIPIALRCLFSRSFFKHIKSGMSSYKGLSDYIYISSIAVHPEYQKHRIGSKILNFFTTNHFDTNSIKGFYLFTDKENNKIVNDYYIKNGFSFHDTIVRKDGRKMNIYKRQICADKGLDFENE